MPNLETVAIVGAGFSGALLAVNVLREAGPSTVLIDHREVFGRGIAYSAPNPSHLLNVRAGNMSAFVDQPRHFSDWCIAHGHGDGTSFVERRRYGAYIGGLLAQSVASADGRLALVRDEALHAEVTADGVAITLASGECVVADALVLAMGNLPPQSPPALRDAGLPVDLHVADPWGGSFTHGLGAGDTVMLLGSGLTMVDVALSLESAGFGGRIIAMSRRGLLPHRHEAGVPPGDRKARPSLPASRLLHDIRRRADTIGWRSAIDELRPFTRALWRGADPAERARFLRHLRPWWDIHRHRLAPPVADRIAAMQARGQLRVVAGKPSAFADTGRGGVAVSWRPRGAAADTSLDIRRVINCTGPLGQLGDATDPLLQGLLADGLARADPTGLGLDVDSESRLIGADGLANTRLFALGPLTRGAFWEIVAVPDIRQQVWQVARTLAQTHWVGGEGL